MSTKQLNFFASSFHLDSSTAKMTCNQLQQLYFEMKERVFKNSIFGLGCNTGELEKLLRDRFGDMKMSAVHTPK